MDASTHSRISYGPISLSASSDQRRSVQEITLAQDKRSAIRENVRALGVTLERLYPVDETRCFGAFLRAIDDVDREIHRNWLRHQVNL